MKDEDQIGFLEHNGSGFYAVGLCCATEGRSKLYHVNVYPYNQHCGCCGKRLVKGQSPSWCELFDGKPSGS